MNGTSNETKQADVDFFNESHPVGATVRYWTGARSGPGRIGKTYAPASLLGGEGGTPVAWVRSSLDGTNAGAIALTHIEAPIRERDAQEALKGERNRADREAEAVLAARATPSNPSLIERRESEWRGMLADAERAVRGGSRSVYVDAAALIGLFITLDTYREREAQATRPRVRVVTCIVCGTRSPAGGTCPGCGGRA